MINDRRKLFQVSHPCSRSKGRESKDGSLKRGLKSKIHLAEDRRGMPVRIIVTEGTTADCTQAESLIIGLNAGFLLADKGYDSDEITDQAIQSGMIPVIPPGKNRKNPREYDKNLYKKRH
jgi:IS5 family transposase